MPVEIPGSVLWLAAAAVALLLLLCATIWRRRRRARDPESRLRKVARDLLAHFLIPDGADGEIHVEYALPTHEGIIVLDFRDVAGHVFGSNTMQDWTVLAEQRRYTISNPQPALYDRVAAVSRLLPAVPVRGIVAFGARANFSKGRPDGVMLLDEVVQLLVEDARGGGRDIPDDYLAGWTRLREEAVAARVSNLLRD